MIRSLSLNNTYPEIHLVSFVFLPPPAFNSLYYEFLGNRNTPVFVIAVSLCSAWATVEPHDNLCLGSQRCHFTLSSDYCCFQQGRWSRTRRKLSKLILEQPGMRPIIIPYFFRDSN